MRTHAPGTMGARVSIPGRGDLGAALRVDDISGSRLPGASGCTIAAQGFAPATLGIDNDRSRHVTGSDREHGCPCRNREDARQIRERRGEVDVAEPRVLGCGRGESGPRPQAPLPACGMRSSSACGSPSMSFATISAVESVLPSSTKSSRLPGRARPRSRAVRDRVLDPVLLVEDGNDERERLVTAHGAPCSSTVRRRHEEHSCSPAVAALQEFGVAPRRRRGGHRRPRPGPARPDRRTRRVRATPRRRSRRWPRFGTGGSWSRSRLSRRRFRTMPPDAAKSCASCSCRWSASARSARSRPSWWATSVAPVGGGPVRVGAHLQHQCALGVGPVVPLRSGPSWRTRAGSSTTNGMLRRWSSATSAPLYGSGAPGSEQVVDEERTLPFERLELRRQRVRAGPTAHACELGPSP